MRKHQDSWRVSKNLVGLEALRRDKHDGTRIGHVSNVKLLPGGGLAGANELVGRDPGGAKWAKLQKFSFV